LGQKTPVFVLTVGAYQTPGAKKFPLLVPGPKKVGAG